MFFIKSLKIRVVYDVTPIFLWISVCGAHRIVIILLKAIAKKFNAKLPS